MELLCKDLENSTIVVNYETFTEGRKVIDIDLENSFCWFDCHSFTGDPVFLPKYYSRNIWKCIGVFCSWSCAKGYARKNNISTEYLTLMYRKINNFHQTIPNPYPRESLKIFGGFLDIDTFRSLDSNYSIKYTEAPIIHSIPQQIVIENIGIVQKNNTKKFTTSRKKNKKQKIQNKIENLLFA